jgi:chitin synthase
MISSRFRYVPALQRRFFFHFAWLLPAARPDWYFESMVQMRYNTRVGFLGYTPRELRNMANAGRSVAIYNSLVYDVTPYIQFPPAVVTPAGTKAPPTNVNFMDGNVLDVFKFSAGMDVTKELNNLKIDKAVLARQKVCLHNLFTIGKVDNRQSPQCLFATYILLVLSTIMVAVIGFKFLASINFGSARAPEDDDKFVMLMLRKTIDSLAKMKYNDKRKLLLVICDGMIVGSGNDNDRPTPLDILGADPTWIPNH